jgi:hypothetical protein
MAFQITARTYRRLTSNIQLEREIAGRSVSDIWSWHELPSMVAIILLLMPSLAEMGIRGYSRELPGSLMYVYALFIRRGFPCCCDTKRSFDPSGAAAARLPCPTGREAAAPEGEASLW